MEIIHLSCQNTKHSEVGVVDSLARVCKSHGSHTAAASEVAIHVENNINITFYTKLNIFTLYLITGRTQQLAIFDFQVLKK